MIICPKCKFVFDIDDGNSRQINSTPESVQFEHIVCPTQGKTANDYCHRD